MSCTTWTCEALRLIERQDKCGLEHYLQRRVPLLTLIKATRSRNLSHVKLGCVCLSLVGDMSCQEDLVACLKRGDKTLANLAEHALWSIWFRSGPTPEANALLADAVCGTGEGQHEVTRKKLDAVIARWPSFAEAHNQRAIVHFLSNRHELSIQDCLATLRLNPWHFGAMAGLGHCHAHEGRLAEALACYEAALAIHPGLDCLQVGAEQIRTLMEQTQSGERQCIPAKPRPGKYIGAYI